MSTKTLLTDAELIELAEEYEGISQRRRGDEARQDSIKLQLKTELAVRDTQKLIVGQFQLLETISERKTVDEKLLLENGVPMATIKASTKVTPVSTLRVTRVHG